MRVIEASMASSLVARRSTEGLTAIQRIMDAASKPARSAAIWSLPVDFNHYVHGIRRKGRRVIGVDIYGERWKRKE
jgi:hypothetical protein